MDEAKSYDRFTFFANWYKILKRRTPEQRSRLIMGCCEYAFDDIWPDFSDDELLESTFIAMQPNIHSSRKFAASGSQGGNTKGKNTPKKPPSKAPKQAPLNSPLNTYRDKDMDGDMEKEADKYLPTEEDIYSASASVGAAAAEAAPPSAETKCYPVCPECGGSVSMRPGKGWECAGHGIVSPAFESIEVEE